MHIAQIGFKSIAANERINNKNNARDTNYFTKNFTNY